jgi:hypothetical protein
MDEFKAELDAKSADEVREDVIYTVMMTNMIDREDATYIVDEMVAGDMSTDDFGPHARAAIERIQRG